MRILITGGFGFIGGRLAQHLSNLGHKITLGTRRNQVIPDWLQEASVSKISWEDASSLALVCKNKDIIIHAARMNHNECSLNPDAAMEFNGRITRTLLDAAVKSNISRFINLSTVHVYSNNLNGLYSEKSTPQNSNPYARAHLKAEEVLINCSKKNSIVGINVRLSNVFGRPAHLENGGWNLVANELCKQAIEKKELNLNSDGSQRRDFLGIGSACNMLAFLCNFPANNTNSFTFNLCSGQTRTVLEMAKLIQKRCKLILGYTPSLILNKNNQIKNALDLNFSIDAICKAGYIVKDTTDNEIDELLLFCQSIIRSNHRAIN